jgi:hypothetical protein
MYKEMKKIQTGNQSLINLFQLNAYQKASNRNSQASIVEVANQHQKHNLVDDHPVNISGKFG